MSKFQHALAAEAFSKQPQKRPPPCIYARFAFERKDIEFTVGHLTERSSLFDQVAPSKLVPTNQDASTFGS